jgi:hypothetical protein
MMNGDWLALKKKKVAATIGVIKSKNFTCKNSLAANNLELQVKRCQDKPREMQKVETALKSNGRKNH